MLRSTLVKFEETAGKNAPLHASGMMLPGEDEAEAGRGRGDADVHRQRKGDSYAAGGAADGNDDRLLQVEDAQ